jgi:O-antigen ligase
MKKAVSVRVISAVIMIAFIVGIIFITSQLGIAGRIIGLLFSLAIGVYAYVEAILVSIKKYRFFLIFGVLAIIVVFALDYNLLVSVIRSPKTINKEFSRIFRW